jgi:hypothetical protein
MWDAKRTKGEVAQGKDESAPHATRIERTPNDRSN